MLSDLEPTLVATGYALVGGLGAVALGLELLAAAARRLTASLAGYVDAWDGVLHDAEPVAL
jgi:hypothetical protein